MAKGKTVSIRIHAKTKEALLILAARIQERERKSISIDEAIVELLVRTEPDIAKNVGIKEANKN